MAADRAVHGAEVVEGEGEHRRAHLGADSPARAIRPEPRPGVDRSIRVGGSSRGGPARRWAVHRGARRAAGSSCRPSMTPACPSSTGGTRGRRHRRERRSRRSRTASSPGRGSPPAQPRGGRRRSSSVGDRSSRRADRSTNPNNGHGTPMCALCRAMCRLPGRSRHAAAARLHSAPMDLHVVGPAATPDERAAIDAVLDPEIGPRAAAGTAASATSRPRATRRTAATTPARDGTCCSPRSTPRPGARRLGEPRRPQPHLEAARRAAGRGVWRRVVLRPDADHAAAPDRRPRVRRHRLPARGRRPGSRRRSRRRSGPRARSSATAGRRGCRSPCLGQCERAPAVLVTVAGEQPGGLVVGELEDADAVVDTLGWAARWRWRVRRGSAPSCRDAPAEPLEWIREPRAPGGRRRAAAARPGRPRRPDVARRLPRRRRLRGADARARARPAGRHRRGHRVEARGPRRGRVPDRAQVGRGRGAAGARRTTSCATRTSPSPGRSRTACSSRSDPFALVESMTIAGLRRRRRARLPLPPRRVPAGARAAGARDRARHARPACSAPTCWAPAGPSTSSCGIGAGAYIGGEETALFESIEGGRGRAAQQAAVPGRARAVRQADGGEQRRDAGQRPADPADGRRGLRADRHRGLHRPEAVLPVRPRRATRASTRSTFGATLGELLELAGGVPGGRAIQAILLGGAAGAFVGPRRARHAADVRGHAGDRARRSARASSWCSTRPPTSPDALRRIAAFFRDESCGQCVPCRVGTVRQEELLARLAGGAAARTRSTASSPCFARSRARRCATRRSAVSARRRRRPSRARCGSGSCTSTGRPPDGDRPASRSEPPAAAEPNVPAAPPDRAIRRRRAHDRRHGRSASRPARRSSRPPARWASTRRPSATSRTSRRSTSAGCASSRSPGRACSRRPARARSSRAWRSRPIRERVRHSRKLVLELLGSSVDLSLAGPCRRTAIGALHGALRRGPRPLRAAGPRRGRRRARRTRSPATTTRPRPSRAPRPSRQPVKVDNDLYVRDYSRCILCYKCVEACGDDAQNTFAIAVAGRGFDARISTEFDVPLPESACVYCGNCIGVCPTGALMFRSEHEHARGRHLGREAPDRDRHDLPVLRRRLHADAPRPGQPDREGHLAARLVGDRAATCASRAASASSSSSCCPRARASQGTPPRADGVDVRTRPHPRVARGGDARAVLARAGRVRASSASSARRSGRPAAAGERSSRTCSRSAAVCGALALAARVNERTRRRRGSGWSQSPSSSSRWSGSAASCGRPATTAPAASPASETRLRS